MLGLCSPGMDMRSLNGVIDDKTGNTSEEEINTYIRSGTKLERWETLAWRNEQF